MIIGSKFKFMEHIKFNTDRRTKVINAMSKSARIDWTLRHETLKTIYRVIEKFGRDLKRLLYLELLEQYVFPQDETFEKEIESRVIFTQDGSPAHFSCFVF